VGDLYWGMLAVTFDCSHDTFSLDNNSLSIVSDKQIYAIPGQPVLSVFLFGGVLLRLAVSVPPAMQLFHIYNIITTLISGTWKCRKS